MQEGHVPSALPSMSLDELEVLFAQAPLGFGSYAQVWAGKHVPTSTPVAIKISSCGNCQCSTRREPAEEDVPSGGDRRRPEEENDGKELARSVLNTKGRKLLRDTCDRCKALQEADVMQELSHKSVCSLLGRVETPEHVCLVLPHAKCGDLRRVVNACGPLPEKTAKRWFRQLVKALRYVHEKGFVHRDVKPENILLTDGGSRVLLADFGFATTWNPNEWLTECVGSMPYIAPEMIKRKPYRGPEVDIWSSGAGTTPNQWFEISSCSN